MTYRVAIQIVRKEFGCKHMEIDAASEEEAVKKAQDIVDAAIEDDDDDIFDGVDWGYGEDEYDFCSPIIL